MLGRWKSEAYQVYVKSALEKLEKASKQLSAAVQIYHLQTVDLYHGCICLSCITLHSISILLLSKENLKPKGSRVSGEVTQLNLRSILVLSWREKVQWHVDYISCN